MERDFAMTNLQTCVRKNRNGKIMYIVHRIPTLCCTFYIRLSVMYIVMNTHKMYNIHMIEQKHMRHWVNVLYNQHCDDSVFRVIFRDAVIIKTR